MENLKRISYQNWGMHQNEKTEIFVGHRLSESFKSLLGEYGKGIILASSGAYRARRKVLEAYLPGGEFETIILDDGEHLKSMPSYSSLIERMLQMDLSRDDVLVYIGGGTLGDLSAFVASTFKRGINLIAVPTTFLSQIDSSIGGKNGINVGGLKNVVGTFYNPSVVFADLDFIDGQDNMIRDSLPEAIKYGISIDPDITEILNRYDGVRSLSKSGMEELITKSIEAKLSVVERDPFELKGVRQILNVGHTVAHAIEAVSENRISHGRAVMMGLYIESKITADLFGGFGISPILERFASIYGLTLEFPSEIIVDKMISAIRNDKKISGGEILFPAVISPGETVIKRLSIERMTEELERWLNQKGK